MILGGLAVIVVVLAGGWYFVNKDSGSMEAEPVAMEKTQVSADAMMPGKEDAVKEGTMADKVQDGAMMQEEVAPAMEKQDAMMAAGRYETYAAEKLSFASKGKVVLFFRAGWCPTCRALDADIRSHLSSIPENVLILDVDYDNAKDLKMKYGVTYQHTLVEVDVEGNQITKWSGSPTLAELLTQVK